MYECGDDYCEACKAYDQQVNTPLYMSSQQMFPRRAVIRTVLVNVITWVPLIAAALAYLATGEGRPRLPEEWELWLGAAASWAITISGLLTRIIANPVIDAKLAKIGVSSQPM